MSAALNRYCSLVLCGCLLSFSITVQGASVVPWLYEVAVPVTSQASAQRLAASQQALLVMLSRVTGLAHVPRSEAISEALENSESYYSRFRYADNADGGVELVVQFEPRAILDLQKRAALPIWRSARDKVLVWLVLEQDGVRSIVGAATPDELGQTLVKRGRARGLDVSLPLLDLEDQLQVTPAAVWGQLSQVLEPASQRYGADVVLVGRISAQAATDWAGEWELWLNNQALAYQTSGPDLAAQAAQVVDQVADELAARNAVLGRDSSALHLSVSGIRNAADYAGLLRYLESLEFIDSVTVRQLRGNELRLDLLTRADADQLLGLFAADQRLFVNRLATIDTADLQLVWRQR